MTDRQLERFGAGGAAPEVVARGSVRVLLIPEAGQVSEQAIAGIRRVAGAGVRVVRAGRCLEADEYGTRRAPPPALGEELAGYTGRDPGVFAALCAAAAGWGLTPRLALTDAGGAPVYGVEIRSAALADGRLVASLCNHLREPVPVVLRRDGEPVASTHLQTGRRLEAAFSAPVLEPLLVEVR